MAAALLYGAGTLRQLKRQNAVPGPANISMNLEFVTFHSDRPSARSDKAHPNANLRPGEYARMIDFMFRSARIFYPQAGLTLLTDAVSAILGVRPAYRRVDGAIDHSALMLSRTRAQNAYVQQHPLDLPLLLIDSDILINGRLDQVFAEDFDIALTWRRSATMPINGGLIVLNNRRPQKARQFMSEVLARYEASFASEAGWFGDQKAIVDWMGIPAAEINCSGVVECRGCKVLLLPCDDYNFSPPNRWKAIARRASGRYVMHFKGERKRLMTPYWLGYLRSQEDLSVWSRLLAYGWRKRIQFLARREERAGAAAGADER